MEGVCKVLPNSLLNMSIYVRLPVVKFKQKQFNMENVRTDITEKLKSSNSILVTVSRNPSVDQLSSLIGLTLILNKLGKHTAAVFSGQVPSTIEFLKPSETIEKTTDSLRDFIIALDKSKADKLRYKVEDNVVRIFITPYRTSITQDDLNFSQGDFNVDAVVALGVLRQEDLDQAITSHGRILHDAAVISINTTPGGELGSMNWTDQQASSLGELVTELVPMLGTDLIDSQIANALLTGIVAETNRFSNQKTSSQTMSASATLMNAGANQQLVATALEKPQAQAVPETTPMDIPTQHEGTLDINHVSDLPAPSVAPSTLVPPVMVPAPTVTMPPSAQSPLSIRIPSNPTLLDQLPDLKLPSLEDDENIPSGASTTTGGSRMITQPPSMGGTLTANTQAEGLEPSIDPLSKSFSPPTKMLDHNPVQRILITPTMTPQPFNSVDISDTKNLNSVEGAVNNPQPVAHLDDARNMVNQALSANPTAPAPIQALNAQPLGDILHNSAQIADQINSAPQPSTESITPPPVPPPIPFQFRNPPQN